MPETLSHAPGTLDDQEAGRIAAEIETLAARLDAVVLGKEKTIRLALACLLARGHLLLNDLPGVGKTTLAHTLAVLLGLAFRRVQFTSDLLPADLVGASVYNRENESFVFHPGPIFTEVLLADEINRASPKTQSALLEAMEEQKVSVDGTSRTLPDPFFVIATQNPSEQFGTFPLPESQLDRFLMSLSLGVPDRDAERRLLREPARRKLLEAVEPLWSPAGLVEVQGRVDAVHVSEPLTEYLLDLVAASRDRGERGLSPRAGLALQRAVRARALMAGRAYAVPDDVQAVAEPVLAHRLGASAAVAEILDAIEVR